MINIISLASSKLTNHLIRVVWSLVIALGYRTQEAAPFRQWYVGNRQREDAPRHGDCALELHEEESAPRELCVCGEARAVNGRSDNTHFKRTDLPSPVSHYQSQRDNRKCTDILANDHRLYIDKTERKTVVDKLLSRSDCFAVAWCVMVLFPAM